jgi:hypothetical protein
LQTWKWVYNGIEIRGYFQIRLFHVLKTHIFLEDGYSVGEDILIWDDCASNLLKSSLYVGQLLRI